MAESPAVDPLRVIRELQNTMLVAAELDVIASYRVDEWVETIGSLLTAVDALQQENKTLKERLGPIDPGGSDLVDELQSAIGFLRHRAEASEATVSRLRQDLMYAAKLIEDRIDREGEVFRQLLRERVRRLRGLAALPAGKEFLPIPRPLTGDRDGADFDQRVLGHGEGQEHTIADVNAGRVDDMIQPRLKREREAAEATHARLWELLAGEYRTVIGEEYVTCCGECQRLHGAQHQDDCWVGRVEAVLDAARPSPGEEK